VSQRRWTRDEELRLLREETRRLRRTISELTPPLEELLKRRGFKVYKKQPAEDLLLPSSRHLDGYYESLKRYSFRLFLRDIIKRQDGFTAPDVTRYATSDVTEDYITYLLDIGMIEKTGAGTYRIVKRPVKSFGETLEWLVAETLRRELSIDTIWGVKFRRPEVGGDYDVLGKINGSIIYIEVKSSPPKQIYQNEISAFMDRTGDLKPEISVFFLDTELRMKDKIVPMFEEELSARGLEMPEFVRLHKELFHWMHKLFIINSRDGISANIERVLISYYREKK